MKSGAVLGLALVLLALPSAASADTRTLTFSDPQDAPPVLSGPANEDVESASLSYDTAGTITISVRFYQPVNGRLRGVGLGFNVAPKVWDLDKTTCSVIDGAYAGGSMYVRPGGVGDGIITVTGATGSLTPTSTRLEDGRVYTMVFNHPVLAGRDWRCGEVGSLRVFFYEFSYCDFAGCPITSSVVDDVKQAGWFPGFAPLPLLERIKAGYRTKADARRVSVGDDVTLSLRNVKLALGEKVAYKACIARQSARDRCWSGSLLGTLWDDVYVTVGRRDLRPLRVRWEVAGKTVASRRIQFRR